MDILPNLQMLSQQFTASCWHKSMSEIMQAARGCISTGLKLKKKQNKSFIEENEWNL